MLLMGMILVPCLHATHQVHTNGYNRFTHGASQQVHTNGYNRFTHGASQSNLTIVGIRLHLNLRGLSMCFDKLSVNTSRTCKSPTLRTSEGGIISQFSMATETQHTCSSIPVDSQDVCSILKSSFSGKLPGLVLKQDTEMSEFCHPQGKNVFDYIHFYSGYILSSFAVLSSLSISPALFTSSPKTDSSCKTPTSLSSA